MTGAPRIGIVGAGRTRTGLGPFLPRFAEGAGARVVAAVGRDQDRAQVAADQLVDQLGHAVAAGTLDDLEAHRPDALIIASPVETHLPALRWAAERGLHTLCEKPLVRACETAELGPLLAKFAAAGADLWENCQWPRVLAPYRTLVGDIGPVTEVAMGLGPAGRGRAMVEDSVSHVISVAQAVLADGDGFRVGESLPQVRIRRADGPAAAAEHAVVTFDLGSPALRVTLHLDHCPRQPRPAWLALNGRRADRVVELPSYRMFLVAADGPQQPVAMGDPTAALVYGFVDAVRQSHPRHQAARRTEIHERARLYRHILEAW